ncbi:MULTISPECIES: signal recognition particle-docking protein FtsY [unclassified Levilactobacillus]|uniref:signal recognition particle-docking protein FtsY n=2 Tax=Lactobacillaceae TaxID=33958 RepID=UPI002FEEDFC7
MGLFDIFRRRAKKEPASEAPASVASSATPEATSAATTESAAPVASSSASAPASSAVEPTPAESAAPASESSVAAESSAAASEAPSSAAVAEQSAATPTDDASTAVAHPATPTRATSEAAPEPAASTEPVQSSAAAAPESVTASDIEATSASVAPDEASAASTEVPDNQVPASAATEQSAEDDEHPVSDEQLYDKGLEKTRHTFGERLNALLANFRHVDEGFFDDLEETLIGADVGFDMAVKLSDELRDEVKLQNAKKSSDVQNVVVEKLVEIYDAAGNNESTALNMAKEGPTVILFVGVNGVGKTTTIGKMANRYHQAGKKVLLAAADTFRAGATEQLDVWAKRADVDIVTGKPQSDPAAVVFDAVQKAKREDYDILFVDTAGRLQNKVNLMNELAKMKRIITREIPTAPHEVLLVLDATTGQNALTQAKLFKESTDVTGIVLTKLDGTARGGIVLAIRNELHVPVKFIGLGEQISDLRPFDPNEFVYGLFKGLIDVKALEK